MKKETKQPEKVKNPTKQKIIVEQGRAMVGEPIPYKVLYTEVVENVNRAKERVKELQEEYKDVEALSICYFSL